MKRAVLIFLSVTVGVVMVVAALLYTPTKTGEKGLMVSKSRLAEHDGLNGRSCWVAVEGNVYAISGFSQWQMGRHLPSGGRATCGRDLSNVLPESPHGKSVLQLLKVVGRYQS